MSVERIQGLLLSSIIWASLMVGAKAAPVGPYFNTVFPAKMPGTNGWTTENAFPLLTFTDPLWVAEIPGTNDLMVVEKAGRVLRFPKLPTASPSEVSVILDISAKVQISEDQGLYRLIFHPEFGQAGSTHANEVFACYSHRPNSPEAAPDKSLWRLSRFIWQPATGTIDPASESVLIQQYDPNRWHNGGALNFDSQGFLLVTCGDGGAYNDILGQSQKLNGGLFGGVLRIDVDNVASRSHAIRRQPVSPAGSPASFPASLSQGYSIPNDNPWLSASGGMIEEFYAIGLRSPHSAHYDAVTGDLWVGDVGQSAREELNRVRKGGNFQWPYMEGVISGPVSAGNFVVVGTETPPAHSYGRTSGGCIIGGMRYRGAKWSSQLGGRTLFGDNIKGTLLTLNPEPVEGPPVVTELLADFGPGIYSGLANICTDSAGEIYLLKLNGQSQSGGTIRKLVTATSQPDPPSLLSATGLFSDTANLVPSAALMPYEVASPLWSDGAAKRRWIAVPNDGIRNSTSEKIAYSATGNWSFPDGTVFVKHFEMPVDARNPALVRRLETRVMVCTPNGGKYGVTYRWNSQGTDAVLLGGAEQETFNVTSISGSTEQRSWTYPSRQDCMQCHTNASGQSLGLRAHQINRPIIRPLTGETVNQLTYFNAEDMLDPSPSAFELSSVLAARSLEDQSAPLEHRVRSYLDSNCAHCHQSGGSVPYFDARLQTPLKGQNLINATIKGQFQLPGGCYLKPGSASLSAVAVRMGSNQPGTSMPPLGKNVADNQAVAQLTQYLNGLSPAEFTVTPAPSARYLRFTGTSGSGNLMSMAELTVLDGNGDAMPRSSLSVESFTSEDTVGSASRIIDGDVWTSWTTTATGSLPKSITLNLGSTRSVGGFEYVPRQDSTAGRLSGYKVETSADGVTWTEMTTKPISGGTSTSSSERYDGWVGRRPVRCTIAAASTSVAKEFPVTIVFDSVVTDFIDSDVSVTGGVVSSLRGSGYYYVATISATQANVTVSVAANKVNTGAFGNSASNTLVVTSGLETPPIPVFSGVVGTHSGPLEFNLSFDKPVTGLTVEDLTITGATLEWMIPSGNNWRLILVPTAQSQVDVKLRDGAVMGTNGVQMAAGISAGSTFRMPVIEREAENLSRSGFVNVSDITSSNGGYMWVPEGSRGTDTSADIRFRLVTSVTAPYAGNYRLRAWTRADNSTSDSFHIQIGSTTRPWRTNQGPNEVGSGLFHPGFARDSGADYVFPLTTSSTSLTIYAAEDGTRIDRLAMIPERPLAFWSGTTASSFRETTAKLHFSSPISGLSMSDFETMDGTVLSIDGSGQDYMITLRTDSAKMLVRLRENAVTDEFSAPSLASEWYFTRFIDTYDQWAIDRGVSPQLTADTLDADGDGLSQLMEYALGLDPKKPDFQTLSTSGPWVQGRPLVRRNPADPDQRLSIVFNRRKGGLPLVYTAEFTDDFTTYSRQTDFTGTTESLDSQWERVIAIDASATGNEPSRFGRLKVSRAE